MSLIHKLLNSGSKRSQIVKKNALGSLAIRVLSAGVDFAKVPILLSFLDAERFGLYVTITSIVYWTHNFDFGLGAGLRYKLSAAISKEEYQLGKKFVSTAYLSMSIIMGVVLLILIPIINILDWQSILNTTSVPEMELIYSISVVLSIFILQFVLELLTYVLQAYQRTAVASLFKPLANVFSLLLIILLKLVIGNSLFWACIAMTLPIVFILVIGSLIAYSSICNEIKPSFSYYRSYCLKDIYSLGLKFFISQSANLIVFQTSSFLITHYVGPSDAAVYNVAFTYYGVVVILNTMMLQPLIPAITDAYVKKELTWIKSTMKTIKKLSLMLTMFSIILLIISPFVISIWTNNKIHLTLGLSICMSIYFILNIWSTPYSCFISGTGKMKLAMFIAVGKILLYVPFAICMVKTFGTIGLILSIIIINNLPNNILYKIQYSKIINNRATGIWNK